MNVLFDLLVLASILVVVKFMATSCLSHYGQESAEIQEIASGRVTVTGVTKTSIWEIAVTGVAIASIWENSFKRGDQQRASRNLDLTGVAIASICRLAVTGVAIASIWEIAVTGVANSEPLGD
jgi:hypothetical protein